MGLLSSNLAFIPFILVLAFFASKQDRGWLAIGRRSLVLATLLLYKGLTHIRQKPASGGENGAGRNPSSYGCPRLRCIAFWNAAR